MIKHKTTDYLSRVIKNYMYLKKELTIEQVEGVVKLTHLDKDSLLEVTLSLLLGVAEDYLKQRSQLKEATDELSILRSENEMLRTKRSLSIEDLRMARMKAGAVGKTAYRYDVSPERIMGLSSLGMTDKEIADKLNISVSTVRRRKKEHEEAIYKKLGL